MFQDSLDIYKHVYIIYMYVFIRSNSEENNMNTELM